MSRFRHHVFVCENERAAGGRPSCGGQGGRVIRERLEAALIARPALWATVKVTACGCLGPCFDGPTLVVYPAGIFYRGVTPADVDEIVTSHLEGDQPVERLRYAWPDE